MTVGDVIGQVICPVSEASHPGERIARTVQVYVFCGLGEYVHKPFPVVGSV